MRKRLLIALAAVALAAAGLLGAAIYLKVEADRNWQLAMDGLERQLGPGASVTHGSLEIALFGGGGTVRDLKISAPGLPRPFKLTASELRVHGLDARRPAFEAGTAGGLVVETVQGRWRIARLELRGFAYDGPLSGSPEGQLQQLSLSSGRAEQIHFEGSSEPALVAELARLELGPVASGRAEQVRLERLTLDSDDSEHAELARGLVEGLALPQLAELLAGRLSPGELLAEQTRIESVLVHGGELEVRVAGLTTQGRASPEGLHREVTLEGLTWEGSDVLLASFWEPIREAGYEPALRLHAESRISEDGHLEVQPLLLELPGAASLELAVDLLGFDARAAQPGEEVLETLIGRARLVSARLVLVDSGGLDVMLEGPAEDQGMTAQQLRQVAAFQVVESMREGAVPRDIGLAIQEFLADPGRLEIRFEPGAPTPLGQLVLLAIAPELAAERFGLTSQVSQPDSE